MKYIKERYACRLKDPNFKKRTSTQQNKNIETARNQLPPFRDISAYVYEKTFKRRG